MDNNLVGEIGIDEDSTAAFIDFRKPVPYNKSDTVRKNRHQDAGIVIDDTVIFFVVLFTPTGQIRY